MLEMLKEIYRTEVPAGVRNFLSHWITALNAHRAYAIACAVVLSAALVAGFVQDESNELSVKPSFASYVIIAGVILGGAIAGIATTERVRRGSTEPDSRPDSMEARFFNLLHFLNDAVAAMQFEEKTGPAALRAMSESFRNHTISVVKNAENSLNLPLRKQYEDALKQHRSRISNLQQFWKHLLPPGKSLEDALAELHEPLAPAPLQLSDDEQKSAIVSTYLEFIRQYPDQFPPYFRMLDCVLECIARAPVGERSDFITILRAKLSDAELLFIFWNSFVTNGPTTDLLGEFAIFTNLQSREGFPTDRQRRWFQELLMSRK